MLLVCPNDETSSSPSTDEAISAGTSFSTSRRFPLITLKSVPEMLFDGFGELEAGVQRHFRRLIASIVADDVEPDVGEFRILGRQPLVEGDDVDAIDPGQRAGEGFFG